MGVRTLGQMGFVLSCLVGGVNWVLTDSQIKTVYSVWQQCMLDSHNYKKYEYKLDNKNIKI